MSAQASTHLHRRLRKISGQVRANGGPAEASALEELGVGDLIVAMDVYKRRQEHRTVGMLVFYSSTCGLGPRSLFHDCKQIWFALRTTAATLELGPLLDRERHVMYISINLR